MLPELHSLADNSICYDGEMAGLSALCEMLEVNTTLQSIKCASCFFLESNVNHSHR